MKLFNIVGTTAALIVTASANERLTWKSSGVEIVGYHWKPRQNAITGQTNKVSKLAPAIVMGHGLAALQTAKLQPYAERFAAEGYHAITFDYRHWGQSAGVPRNIVNMTLQQADYRAAVSHVRTLPGIDPSQIIIWGSSLSGGTVLSLGPEFFNTTSSGVIAVIAQVPHVNGYATSALPPRDTLPHLVNLSLEDTKRAGTGLPPIYVPVANSTGKLGLLTQAGALAGYESIEPVMPGPEYRNIAARFIISLPLFSPDATAAQSRLPTFIGIGMDDDIVSAPAAVALAGKMPNATTYKYEGCGHFDVYPGKKFYARNVENQVRFLKRFVPVRGSGRIVTEGEDGEVRIYP